MAPLELTTRSPALGGTPAGLAAVGGPSADPRVLPAPPAAPATPELATREQRLGPARSARHMGQPGATLRASPFAVHALLSDPIAGQALSGQALAAQRSLLSPSKALEGDLALRKEAVFKTWVADRINPDGGTPHVAQTFLGLVGAVRTQAPKRVGELLDLALELARAEVAKIPGVTSEPRARAHLELGTALIALSGHALRTGASKLPENFIFERFPKYLNDGRAADDGWDKCCHLLNQLMFSYVTLYDQEYGDGALHAAFHATADGVDEGGIAAKIAAVYDQNRGRSGPFLKSARPAPPDAHEIYFPRPTDLTAREAQAYDGAVRVGDAHEHLTTRHGGYSVEELGMATHAEPWMEDTRHVLSGLRDPGLRNELFANRQGAYLGVQLFRDPSAPPVIAHDRGDGWPNGPYASDGKGQDVGFDPYPTRELTAARRAALTKAVGKDKALAAPLMSWILKTAGWPEQAGATAAKIDARQLVVTRGPIKLVVASTPGNYEQATLTDGSGRSRSFSTLALPSARVLRELGASGAAV